MKIIDLKQGSEEWKTWRRSHITASDMPIILGVSPYCSPQTLWARKLGLADEQPINPSMRRGTELEPHARNVVNADRNARFVPLVVEHDKLSWAGASLDGYDKDQDALLEVKCPNRKEHDKALLGQVPEKYMPQLQWQMLVTDCIVCHYLSWWDDDNWHMFHVERDQDYIWDTLVPAGLRFWNCLQTGVEPTSSEASVSSSALHRPESVT